MKKIEDARLTILFGNGTSNTSELGVVIKIEDGKSSNRVMNIFITPDQWMQLISRLSAVSCDVEITDIPERINKKMENKKFHFEFDYEGLNHDARSDLATEVADEKCPNGWISDGYFNSQGSFYIKDGVQMAQTTIRRWVD